MWGVWGVWGAQTSAAHLAGQGHWDGSSRVLNKTEGPVHPEMPPHCDQSGHPLRAETASVLDGTAAPEGSWPGTCWTRGHVRERVPSRDHSSASPWGWAGSQTVDLFGRRQTRVAPGPQHARPSARRRDLSVLVSWTSSCSRVPSREETTSAHRPGNVSPAPTPGELRLQGRGDTIQLLFQLAPHITVTVL